MNGTLDHRQEELLRGQEGVSLRLKELELVLDEDHWLRDSISIHCRLFGRIIVVVEHAVAFAETEVLIVWTLHCLCDEGVHCPVGRELIFEDQHEGQLSDEDGRPSLPCQVVHKLIGLDCRSL